MSKREKFLTFMLIIGSSLGLLLLLELSNPLQSGPLSVLIVLGLVYIFIACTVYLVVSYMQVVVRLFGLRRPAIGKAKLRRAVAAITLCPVFLLALNSLGGLELKDVLLVMVLIVLAYLYVERVVGREA